MTDQIVTSNTDLETVIAAGMVAGDRIYIREGATVTMTESNSLCIEDIRVEDGIFKIDGKNISSGNLINFVGQGGGGAADVGSISVYGPGKLEVDGDWYDLGTTDGSNNQSISTTTFYGADFRDVICGLWIETGRRIDFDNASGTLPEVDDWVCKVSDRSITGRIVEVNQSSSYLVVKFLTGTLINNDAIEVRKIVDNFGPDYEISWTADVNNVSGDIKEAGIYQEFANCVCDLTDRLTEFGAGMSGFVFAHQFQSTTLTLGGSTGGFIPPSGCNIRVPNVNFASATLSDFALGVTTNASGTNEALRYNMCYSAFGGRVTISICNIGSASMRSANGSFGEYYYFSAPLSMGIVNCGSMQKFHNCISISDPLDDAYDGYIRLNGQMIGSEALDCLIVSTGRNRPHYNVYGSVGETTVKNCISVRGDTSVGGIQHFYVYRSTNVTIDNNVAFCSSNTGSVDSPYITSYSINTHFLRSKGSMSTKGTQKLTPDSLYFSATYLQNSSLIGYEFIDEGLSSGYLMVISDCSYFKIRAIGMIDEKIDCGEPHTGTIDSLINFSGVQQKISIARCWKTGGYTEECAIWAYTVSDFEMINCSGDYVGSISPRGADEIRIKGVHGGNGRINTGIMGNYAATYGSIWHDVYISDTAGAIFILMNTKTSATSGSYTINAGTPVWNLAGQLKMLEDDVVTWEQPYFTLGITGLTGNYTAALGSCDWNADEMANITLEFQYDINNGSGWNGAWLDLRTSSNLTGITVDPADGVKFKIRATATADTTGISCIAVETSTTLAAQKANFYPIDQVFSRLTVNVDVSDFEYRIYIKSPTQGTIGTTELQGVEDYMNNTFTYDYQYTEDVEIGIQIIKNGYKEYLRYITLTSNDYLLDVYLEEDTNLI